MAEFCEVMKQIERYCNAQSDCCRCKLYEILGEYCPSDFIQDLIQKDQVYTIEKLVLSWAKENPEPNYPMWGEWFLKTCQVGLTDDGKNDWDGLLSSHIPANIAQKLGIKPKGE